MAILTVDERNSIIGGIERTLEGMAEDILAALSAVQNLDGETYDEGAGKHFGYFATVWKEGDRVVVHFYHPYANVGHVVVPSREAGGKLARAYVRAWDNV